MKRKIAIFTLIFILLSGYIPTQAATDVRILSICGVNISTSGTGTDLMPETIIVTVPADTTSISKWDIETPIGSTPVIYEAEDWDIELDDGYALEEAPYIFNVIVEKDDESNKAYYQVTVNLASPPLHNNSSSPSSSNQSSSPAPANVVTPPAAPILNFTGFFGAFGVNITTSPITNHELIAQMKEFADQVLSLLTLLSDGQGVELVLLGGMNINIDLPEDEALVLGFEGVKQTGGKLLIGVAADSEGKIYFIPVEGNVEDALINARLQGGKYAVVFFEYLRSDLGNFNFFPRLQLSSVFYPEYYAWRYPDVVAVFGNNPNLLFAHFIAYGFKEGRSGDGKFDISFYQLAYHDLIEIFGNDILAYLRHFSQNGLNEGRVSGVWQGIARD